MRLSYIGTKGDTIQEVTYESDDELTPSIAKRVISDCMRVMEGKDSVVVIFWDKQECDRPEIVNVNYLMKMYE